VSWYIRSNYAKWQKVQNNMNGMIPSVKVNLNMHTHTHTHTQT
jgi:hypothetical protein